MLPDASEIGNQGETDVGKRPLQGTQPNRLKVGVWPGGDCRSPHAADGRFLTRCCLSRFPKPAIQIADSGRPAKQQVRWAYQQTSPPAPAGRPCGRRRQSADCPCSAGSHEKRQAQGRRPAAPARLLREQAPVRFPRLTSSSRLARFNNNCLDFTIACRRKPPVVGSSSRAGSEAPRGPQLSTGRCRREN